jgi:hypothetical protein
MKKLATKLGLNRDTLLQLTSREAQGAGGGLNIPVYPRSEGNHCVTDACNQTHATLCSV